MSDTDTNNNKDLNVTYNPSEYSAAAIIGRFQVPTLTEAHRALIEHIKVFPKHAILVGVAPTPLNVKNPLDFLTRQHMLRDEADFKGPIMPLPDMGDNSQWSRQLDTLLTAMYPTDKVLLVGGRDSFKPFYEGRFDVYELPEIPGISGTDARADIARHPLASEDFRRGVIYAVEQKYPIPFAVADATVYKIDPTNNFKCHIALGWRRNDSSLRLAGGFVDPHKDASIAAAANRELNEEFGNIFHPDLEYVADRQIPDWRYQGENRIYSVCYMAPYSFGNLKPGDDMDGGVEWFDIEDVDAYLQRNSAANAGRYTINKAHIPFVASIVDKLRAKINLLRAKSAADLVGVGN